VEISLKERNKKVVSSDGEFLTNKKKQNKYYMIMTLFSFSKVLFLLKSYYHDIILIKIN